MKNYLAILLFTCQFVVSGQTDTSKLQKDTSSDLIYDLFEGETYRDLKLANGWRRSVFNGGNKHSYWNLYVEGLNFEKDQTQPILYRFKNGKLFNGFLNDTLYNEMLLEDLFPRPTFEEVPILLFQGNCQNGLMQGKVTLSVPVMNNGTLSNLTISECKFENGEIVGKCKYWDINSVVYKVNCGIVEFREYFSDFSELIKSLELTEFIYVKGRYEWTQKTTTKSNGEKITTTW